MAKGQHAEPSTIQQMTPMVRPAADRRPARIHEDYHADNFKGGEQALKELARQEGFAGGQRWADSDAVQSALFQAAIVDEAKPDWDRCRNLDDHCKEALRCLAIAENEAIGVNTQFCALHDHDIGLGADYVKGFVAGPHRFIETEIDRCISAAVWRWCRSIACPSELGHALRLARSHFASEFTGDQRFHLAHCSSEYEFAFLLISRPTAQANPESFAKSTIADALRHCGLPTASEGIVNWFITRLVAHLRHEHVIRLPNSMVWARYSAI